MIDRRESLKRNKIINNYCIIIDDLLSCLEKSVVEFIKKGWQPCGELTQNHNNKYMQVMVKYKEEPPRTVSYPSFDPFEDNLGERPRGTSFRTGKKE